MHEEYLRLQQPTDAEIRIEQLKSQLAHAQNRLRELNLIYKSNAIENDKLRKKNAENQIELKNQKDKLERADQQLEKSERESKMGSMIELKIFNKYNSTGHHRNRLNLLFYM